MNNFEQQLKKGVLDLIVLKSICNHDTYGYELLCSIEQRSNGLICLKEGSLYPILYRLEDNGNVVTYEVQKEGSRQRKKYYSITDAGRKCLDEWNNSWDMFQNIINEMMRSE